VDIIIIIYLYINHAKTNSLFHSFHLIPSHSIIITTLSVTPKFRVAVIGGGPSGACAAEALAANPNIECTLFERKMDNAKPCGGAIPVCMIEEFNLPTQIIDRKVCK
jgi:geranylgeranyl reductase